MHLHIILLTTFYYCTMTITGLRFDVEEGGIIVDEDVGTVELWLCIIYGGENVPPFVEATFERRGYGKSI